MAETPSGWHDFREVPTSLGPIRYRDLGDGPTVVFLHLVLGNGEIWRETVARLAPDVRCIVPDLPMGAHSLPADPDADLSPTGLARAVADLLDALDLTDVTLVGNDTGGAIAQLVAAHHPSRLARLVLSDCDAYETFPPRLFAYLKWTARVPGGLRVAGHIAKRRSLRRLPIAYGRVAHRIDHAAADAWAAALLADRAVRRDAAKVLRAISPRPLLDAVPRLREFDRPVLLAWAPEDRLFPLALAERLMRDLPDARLETVEDSLALVPWDRPDRLAELVAKFVRQG